MAGEGEGGGEGGEGTGGEGGEGTTLLGGAGEGGQGGEGSKGGDGGSGDGGGNPEGGDQGGKGGEGSDGSGGGTGDELGGAPESYADFTMPDGVEVSSDMLDKVLPIFKELDLNQDSAQKLVDFYQSEMSGERINQAVQEAQGQIINDQAEGWLADFNKSDIGGNNSDATMKIANKAMEKFGSAGLKEVLNATGIGNHPEVIRMMHAVGIAISEDSFVSGGQGGGDGGKVDLADKMYGSKK